MSASSHGTRREPSGGQGARPARAAREEPPARRFPLPRTWRHGSQAASANHRMDGTRRASLGPQAEGLSRNSTSRQGPSYLPLLTPPPPLAATSLETAHVDGSITTEKMRRLVSQRPLRSAGRLTSSQIEGRHAWPHAQDRRCPRMQVARSGAFECRKEYAKGGSGIPGPGRCVACASSRPRSVTPAAWGCAMNFSTNDTRIRSDVSGPTTRMSPRNGVARLIELAASTSGPGSALGGGHPGDREGRRARREPAYMAFLRS